VSFSRTLLKGIERFKKAASLAKGGKLSGKDAFELWDTYGFPSDLTQAITHNLLSTSCARAMQRSV
jgi:alanyl-tRNA synthetase